MVTPFLITAFADEISPNLSMQIATLQRTGVTGIDVRSVDNVNVLDLTAEALDAVRDACQQAGIMVQSVGSPVNKADFSPNAKPLEMAKLMRAIVAARRLGTARIRVFTPAVAGGVHADLAPEILRWMSEQKRIAEGEGMILLHENDAEYWGAYPENAKRLFGELGGASFKAVFDFANAVLYGFDPLGDWFPWLTPHLDTLHIKDAVAETRHVVPAGRGDARVAETLKLLVDCGWKGTLTLEPHLEAAGPMGGFTGTELFDVALRALKSVLAEAGVL